MENATPSKKPINIGLITGAIFLPISIISLINGEYFDMVVWLTIGLGLVIANPHYLPKGADIKDVPTLPKWRKYLSIAMVVIGMTAFGYIVGRDVKAKVERSSAVQTEAIRKM
jgi:hypothetical protein